MSNVYEECPKLENDKFLLRFIEETDMEDLLKVYSDKNALPFFNSDNCDGDNFYYATLDRMKSAYDFWVYSYREKWFVRWSIVDKKTNEVIGTIELFKRIAKDETDGMGTLRLDVRSDYEKEESLKSILEIIKANAYDLFDTDTILTKIPNYAVERAAAAESLGFIKRDITLVGDDGTQYRGYWTVTR